MKIDSKTLLSFLKKININGEIKDCVMKFEADGLHVDVVTPDKNGAVSGMLSVAHFTNYAVSKLAVKDLNLLINILKDMNGLVDISTESNRIIFASSTKDAKMPMMQENFVTCRLDSGLPVLEHDAGFITDSKTLSEAKKDAEKLKTKTVKVSVKDGQLSITAGEDGFTQITNKVSVAYKDVESFYGDMFLKVINVLDGIVTIAFDADYPLLITQNSDDGYTIQWLVSPATEVKEE